MKKTELIEENNRLKLLLSEASKNIQEIADNIDTMKPYNVPCALGGIASNLELALANCK